VSGHTKPHSRAELDRLLEELLENPENREAIERKIEETFTQTRAVVVLDLSGFSRTTLNRGIIQFLLMIDQMELLAIPSVEKFGGIVLKQEADNVFCLFDSVADALGASDEIRVRLDTANLVLPADRELYASIGIGFGPVLNIGDEDLWGVEVNLASKLGEDIAQKGEVLLTEAARAELADTSQPFEERHQEISGLTLTYYAATKQ